MPQSAQEIVQTKGFWGMPEHEQVQALGQANPQFLQATPEIQRGVLTKAREQFGPKGPPGATAASASPARANQLNKGPEPTALTRPLLEVAKPLVHKAADKMGGGFGSGMFEGFAEAGIDQTSLVNLGLLAGGMFFPEGWVAKIGAKSPKALKLVRGAQSLIRGGFNTGIAADAFSEYGNMQESLAKGDKRGLGKAVAKEISDALMLSYSLKSGHDKKAADRAGKTSNVGPTSETRPAPPPGEPVASPVVETRSTVNVGGKERPVVERSNPEQGKRAVEARAKSKPAGPVGPRQFDRKPAEMAREEIEREIGELSEQQEQFREKHEIHSQGRYSPELRADYQEGAQRFNDIGARIRELRDQIPEFSTDPKIRIKQFENLPRPERGQQATPGAPVTGPAQRKARAQAAVERAKEQDPTRVWRTWGEGLGVRLAPEEIGELPTQELPVSRPIERTAGKVAQAEGGAAAGERRVRAGDSPASDFEQAPNPQEKQFIADRLPGVPRGARVIPRGLTPQGFLIDVVDASGRMIQKTLPFRDTLDNMVNKRWLRPARMQETAAEPFRSEEPPAPAQPPGSPVVEIDRREQPPNPNLPAVISRPAPPPGPPIFAPPEQMAVSVGRMLRPEPAALPEPGVTQSGSLAENLELAKNQPSAVIQNFLGQMRQAFVGQLQGQTPEGLPAASKAEARKAMQSLQGYLEPFEAILRERGDLGPAKPPRAARTKREATPPAPAAPNPGTNPEPKADATPPASTSNVGPSGPAVRPATATPEVEGAVQNLIDTHLVQPKGHVKSIPETITVELLDPSRGVLHSVDLPAGGFTPDAVQGVINSYPKTWAIRVSSPDVPSMGKHIKIIPPSRPAPPPGG